MELKPYDKPWLPAFKGAFLIIFGILSMLRIVGTITSLAVLFAFLIAVMGILLISAAVRYKTTGFRGWTIASGIIHLAFCVFLASRVETAKNIYEAREGVIMVILVWIMFYAITEITEAGILIRFKNAFATLFIINALLTLLFGYFLYVIKGNFTPEGVFYVGLIAFVIGIVNVLSSYLLSRVRIEK